MNKQMQNFTRLSVRLVMMFVVATMTLFFFSCKKKKLTPPPVPAETYYTVTFNSKEGTKVDAIKVKKGNTITLPASPTKAGSTFGGWFTDDNTFKNQFDAKAPITADITLYAKWDVPEHTVTFDSRGGSEVKAVKVKKGGTITLPDPPPTKAGSTFGGWYTDKEASTTPFVATTPITADLTLYAKWNAVVSFSLSSTSFTSGGDILPKYAYPIGGEADRLNTSPQLSWANAPAATTSFLIIMQDLDAVDYAHWTAYNIPANKTSVAEGEYRPKESSQLGSRVGNKYEGPWPPPVKHTYQITVFALDLPTTHFNETNFPASKAEAETKLGTHILAKASITGTFTGK